MQPVRKGAWTAVTKLPKVCPIRQLRAAEKKGEWTEVLLLTSRLAFCFLGHTTRRTHKACELQVRCLVCGATGASSLHVPTGMPTNLVRCPSVPASFQVVV